MILGLLRWIVGSWKVCAHDYVVIKEESIVHGDKFIHPLTIYKHYECSMCKKSKTNRWSL